MHTDDTPSPAEAASWLLPRMTATEILALLHDEVESGVPDLDHLAEIVGHLATRFPSVARAVLDEVLAADSTDILSAAFTARDTIEADLGLKAP